MEEIRPQKAAVKRRGPLAQYRLYFLRGSDSHITHSHEFEAEEDERALQIAEGWREGRAAELWAGARKLKSWEADR